MIDDEDEDLLTLDELCSWLKVKPSWVYERVRTRKGLKLPHIKLGRYLRFERSAVKVFLRRQRRFYLDNKKEGR